MWKGLLSFLGGVIVGGGAAYLFTKKKYEQIANEEIESMREYYMEKSGKKEHVESVDIPREERESETVGSGKVNTKIPEETLAEKLDKTKEIVEGNGYLNYDSIHKDPSMRERREAASRIYRINRAKYENDEAHDKVRLTYYSLDDILVDDRGIPIENRDVVIDGDNLEWFGEHEEGMLFVRNEVLMTDYEVELIDDISWHEEVDN